MSVLPGKKRTNEKFDSSNIKTKKIKKDFNGKDKSKHAFSKKGTKQENTKSKPTEKLSAMQRRTNRKELKLNRRLARGSTAPSAEAKRIYEELKCKSKTNVKKSDLAQSLYTIMKKGDAIKGIRAHDTARIMQCLLKFGSQDLRKEIAEELSPMMVEMAMSKYARFCVIRLIKYGSNTIKQKMFDTLLENVVKLTLNSFSSSIVDALYSTFANKKQRALMKQAFYGDMYKKLKDESIMQISDTYKNAPHMKNAVLSALKSNLEHAANKAIVENSLLHTLLLEYLTECSEEDRNDIVAIYSPLVSSFVTSWDGCKAGIFCFWYSATRERRAIVKSLKEHLERICCHEHGHAFIIAIVNTMDDTKAMKKVIFDPIYANLEGIVANSYGRKILEWFVSPADAENFHPHLISFLDDGLKYSKKDKEIRRKEILEQIEEPLCQAIVTNPAFWLSNGQMGLVTATILKKLNSNNFAKAAESLAKIICDPDWTINSTDQITDEKEPTKLLGIEDSGLHIALKKILKYDKQRAVAGDSTFGQFIIEEVKQDMIEVWVKLNRACFILVNVLENSSMELQNKIKKLLTPYKRTFAQQKHAGAKLILEKIDKIK